MQMFVFIDVSTMPLGALLELRDRIGSRLYEKIVFRQGAGEAQEHKVHKNVPGEFDAAGQIQT
jgi:hypothetical protein